VAALRDKALYEHAGRDDRFPVEFTQGHHLADQGEAW
jgi:hypothetical protein